MVENANNIEIAQFMTDAFPHPYTKENAKTFIEFANKNAPPSILAIDVNGKAIGGVGIHLQTDVLRKTAELGYWVGQKYWGNNTDVTNFWSNSNKIYFVYLFVNAAFTIII